MTNEKPAVPTAKGQPISDEVTVSCSGGSGR